MSFDRAQQSYFVHEINRAIPTRTAINPLALDAALGEPDGGAVRLDGLIAELGPGTNVANALKHDATCQSLPYPGPGMRDPAARAGCGWWFAPDPAIPSTGAYGTRRGPMNATLDTTIGPGKWIWDPREAQRLEGAKHMANIRACPDIQFAKFPNVGWCPSTGMALLTDSAGNPLYPQMPGGDCPGTAVIMNAANCPPPPSPSSGGAAAAAAQTPSVSSLCTPNAAGALSPYCLQALVRIGGCSALGPLDVAFGNNIYAGDDYTVSRMNNTMSAYGWSLNAHLMNDGKMTVNDALSAVGQLRSVAMRGDGSRVSGAAAKLCFGREFDPCALSPSQTGPWDSYADCIIEAAMKKGYSPQGNILPGRTNISYWNQFRTWGDVLANIDAWMAQAHNSANPIQAQAIENVYGLNLNFPPQSCPIPVFVLGPYGMAPWGTITNFPNDSEVNWVWVTPNAQMTAPNGMALMTKKYYNATQSTINATIYIASDDYITLVVNGSTILNNQAFLRQTVPTPVVIQPGPNLFEFHVQNSGGAAGLAVLCRDSAGNNLFVSDDSFDNRGYQ